MSADAWLHNSLIKHTHSDSHHDDEAFPRHISSHYSQAFYTKFNNCRTELFQISYITAIILELAFIGVQGPKVRSDF